MTLSKFDILAISETRIKKQVPFLNNLNLNIYSFEFIEVRLLFIHHINVAMTQISI